MADLQQLVEQAKRSELFTAPHLEHDLAAFLTEQASRIRELAAQAVQEGVEHVYFVGGGGSWASMYSGKYMMDRLTDVPSDALTSYELIWRNPGRLNAKAWVFLASYSGRTEDTAAALAHAKAGGAKTVAIVKRGVSPMAEQADVVIDYDSTALYILPLATVYLFALEVGRLQGRTDMDAVLEGLMALPPVLGRVYREAQARAAELSEQFADSSLLYVVGAGPLYGLAYKFALTVFMENIRVHGSVVESAELRHGPMEMLDRQAADIVFLVGTDESRAMTERVIKLVQGRPNVRTIVYDMQDYPEVHPLLTPFVGLILLQWFAVYSALRAGIHDLDERVFMGRGILDEGKAGWP